MNRRKVLAAVFVVGAVGLTLGLTTASNMAFKINYVVQNPTGRAGTANCTVCGNWVSLPFSTQFQGLRMRSLCAALGADVQFLAQPGAHTGVGNATTIDTTRVDSLAGPHNCLAAESLTPNWVFQPNAGVRAILRTASTGDKPAILVGADVPGTQQLLRKTAARGGSASCSVCGNWVQLPYHTTAVRLYDLCTEMPGAALISQPGSSTGAGNNTQLNANNIDSLTTPTNCAASASLTPNPVVQIGKPVRITVRTSTAQEPPGDILWSPAHF
jgi:hypothetical protein